MGVIMTWKGLDESLPSILLNSHIDVVPVFEVSYVVSFILNIKKFILVLAYCSSQFSHIECDCPKLSIESFQRFHGQAKKTV